MVGIFQNNKLLKDFKKISDRHWENVYEIIKPKSSFKSFNIAIFVDYIRYDFAKIVKLNYEQLVEFAEKLEKSSTITYDLEIDGNITHSIDFIKWYEQFRSKFGLSLVKDLELSVCPYCNRSYINEYEDKVEAEFDHFYPKSNKKYECLALTISNLVPCCHSCNHIKSTHELINGYSPYNHSYSTDSLIKFSYLKCPDGSYKVIASSLNKIFDDNIKYLKLESRYSIHENLINDLIIKEKKYTFVYRKSLENLVPNFEELYYGVRFSEEEYYLRPLSKFIKDIIEEIKRH